jgi:hypothetical protein
VGQYPGFFCFFEYIDSLYYLRPFDLPHCTEIQWWPPPLPSPARFSSACRLTVSTLVKPILLSRIPTAQRNPKLKLINAWPSFLRDHARRIMQLFSVLTHSKRSSLDTKLEKLQTNEKDNTPVSVASLPSSSTALHSSFIPSLPIISAQWGSRCCLDSKICSCKGAYAFPCFRRYDYPFFVCST